MLNSGSTVVRLCVSCLYSSGNYRMVWVGADLQNHPVPPTCLGQGYLHCPSLLKAPSILLLHISRDGASTASLSNLCQGLTPLTGRNFLLITLSTAVRTRFCRNHHKPGLKISVKSHWYVMKTLGTGILMLCRVSRLVFQAL